MAANPIPEAVRDAAREAVRLLRVNRYDAAADELEEALTAAQQQGQAVAVELTKCCGREECGGECGNPWRGMEWVRKQGSQPTQQGGGEVCANCKMPKEGHGWLRPVEMCQCATITAPASAPVGVDYAKRLATSLWQRYYRGDAPQWEPCEDLMGLLSQIDNMVSGLTRAAQQPAAKDAEIEALRDRAERLAEALRGIETKLVHSMDHARSSLERKRAMSECVDSARAALEQEAGRG